MKIFLLASSFPDKSNPMSGIFNFRFVKQMSELGEDVDVVFFRMWSPRRKLISSYLYDDIRVTQVCLPLIPFTTSVFLKINNFICRSLGWLMLKKQLSKSDLIHSVSLTTNGIIAGYWAKRLNKPHIAHAIGSDVNSDMILMGKKSYDWIKNIDGIITNSYDLEKSLKKYFVEKPKIKTIYRGIQIGLLQIDHVNRGVSFLYLGGLSNKTSVCGINTKGGVTLMEAWGKAEAELYLQDCNLYFGGPASNHNLFVKWKNSLKYPERVFLIGQLDPVEVKSYLHKSDVVVVPSMEEGLPNFLTESCASGKPAIGSTAGGIPEVIINGETGYIFEKGNVEQLSELLIQSANNPGKNKIMGRKAYEHVKTSFNSNCYSQKVLSFYKTIINDRNMLFENQIKTHK
jgi:glycosyltransferase involved in cell wall biosynthesis